MKWLFWSFIASVACLAILIITSGIRLGPPRSPEVRITVEINHLSQAIQTYKEDHGQYPPCMAEADHAGRHVRFMRHFQAAWSNSKRYQASSIGFGELNRRVGEEWKYHFQKPNGSLAPLELGMLDPAEALVFWLGGFPTPIDPTTTQPVASRKVFGFHSDNTDPFKRDLPEIERLEPLRSRTVPRFPFDPTRLMDNDHDGWWEYVPALSEEKEFVAPYVYFDAASYNGTGKPITLVGKCFYPRDPRLLEKWGPAIPYSITFDATPPSQLIWANESSFQIISAGLDGKYGPVPGRRLTTIHPLETFDATDGFQRPHPTDKTEHDNLTNLSNKSLGTMAP